MPTIEEARDWYPLSEPVHGFDHVLRVYRLAERLAQAEDADVEIVRAAVLLHDAQPAVKKGSAGPAPQGEESRAKHQHTSAEFARQILLAEGWPEERIAAVQHCIRAHRFRDDSEQPQTLEAKVLFDADKLDAIGATGVARAVAYAARAGQPFFAWTSERFIQTGDREPGEPYSSYHEYIFKLHKLKDRLYTASAREIAAGRHRFLEAFYEQLADEMRGEV